MPRPEHLVFFAKFIEAEMGIVYAEHNDFQLQKRLEDIVKKRGLPSVADLYQTARLNMTRELKKTICDAATNNETYFFRDPKVFDVLRDSVLPRVFENAYAESRRPRIWSMACSYGQEPFSLALLCRDLVGQKSSRRQLPEIFATDIATHAIEKANSGVYTQAEVDRGLPAAYLGALEKQGSDWKFRPEIRGTVKFAHVNILTDSFVLHGKFDLVLCRNVLIYQSVANKAEVVRKIKGVLQPNGCLVLGAGETLIGVTDLLRTERVDGAILFTQGPAPARVA